MPEDDDRGREARGNDRGRFAAEDVRERRQRDRREQRCERDTIVSVTVIRKMASAGGSASGVSTENTPHAVATPLPPRNLSQIG